MKLKKLNEIRHKRIQAALKHLMICDLLKYNYL